MSASEVITREIATLDIEIASMHPEPPGGFGDQTLRLSALRTRRNALASPMCRLPGDIAQHLFRIHFENVHQIYDMFLHDGIFDLPKIHHATAIFSICTHLRNLALASPSLWKYIDIAWRKEWRKLCLKRSCRCELVIMCEQGWMRGTLERLISLKDRAREIYIQDSPPSLHQSIQPLVIQKDLPHLRTLLYCAEEDIPTQLDASFLAGNTSSIVNLHLFHVNIPASISIPALVHLRLTHVTCESHPACLIQTIERSPLLEHLHIHDVAWSNYESRCRRIVLPHLESLSLRGQVNLVAMLMQHLPDPSRRIDIRIETDHSGVDDDTILACHKEILIRVRALFNTPNHVLRLVPSHKAGHHIPVVWTLAVQEKEGASTSCYFSDFHRIQDARLLLNLSPTIYVEDVEWRQHPLFIQAARDPIAWLPNLQALYVEASGIQHYDLQAWLRARIAVGNRLKALYLDWKETPPSLSEELTQFKEEVARDGLVDVLWQVQEHSPASVVWERESNQGEADTKS
jgi:hypothetical protein